ncbi:uncharacterized protein PV09_01256 [Verruconis gallopava]|uniref:DUF4139 domain-containing protein n=1 Tax=Verruconis gallopava TaxID=253628 RepID=A0A0D2ANP3_9PEZI|nr:uncharacterized protein PV09_01256 [Verruconis gallopava]KIW08338.1 hypothetical protein PV09_01256 [Verruconis gallopava]
MAEDIPRQTFLIKDLPTKSVTLYPARAHIVREIRDVILRPGQNEIEIFGLTAEADQNSIQVDGKGSATITDMTLELIPNNEQFSDVYPSESNSSEDEEDDYEDSDDEIESVKVLTHKIKQIDLEIETASEQQKSVERRCNTLDAYANGITGATGGVKFSAKEVSEALSMYEAERRELFSSHKSAELELKKLRKQKARLESERTKIGRDEKRRKARTKRDKEKQKEQVRRRKEEKRKEAERARSEKRKFWANDYYKITLGLETSLDSPSSSRRNSLDSVTLSGLPLTDPKDKSTGSVSFPETTVTLLLSYVANSAFWTPRYDLSINSVRKSATIVYRAEFTNGTSETWKDAKIILSTSQTSYSGLDDKAPFMPSWQVKLGRSWDNNSGGLLSISELKGHRYQNALSQQASKANYKMKASANSSFSPWDTAPPQIKVGGLSGSSIPAQQVSGSNNLYETQTYVPHPPPTINSGLSVSITKAQKTQNTSLGALGASGGSSMDKELKKRGSRLGGGIFGGGGAPKDDTMSNNSAKGEYIEFAADETVADENYGQEGEADNGLDFEESVWEDNGLTANYELPGIRTLVPSSTARRHKIASLTAVNIQLSYVSVPKLRSAAFLRAKIRNPSSTVTLLKGMVGVTLDGSFLGNINFPRVSPNQIFSLPLGVDPAIQISYPKPNVHRTTSGFINKESAHTFQRSIWITNTKSTPVELLVIDQVPVSQDERLRVSILQPRGLNKEGDATKAGQSAKEGANEVVPTTNGKNAAWGMATATLKKNGEVNWTVNLEKGGACLLKLEYETRMPSGASIVEVEGYVSKTND